MKKPISVAQHSIYVARLCEGHGCELQGLLHDAAEAYIGDITKWLKRTEAMTAFRHLEADIQRTIFKKFKCDTIQHKMVSKADKIMVRFEGMKGFDKNFKIDHPHYPNLTEQEIENVGKWGFWRWRESERLFLDHFRLYNET